MCVLRLLGDYLGPRLECEMGGSAGRFSMARESCVGRPPFRSQSPESACWNTPPKEQTLRPNLNDTPSRDETLAIKISTTTPVFHQKSRQTAFAWHLE